jgi:hypothetical protein
LLGAGHACASREIAYRAFSGKLGTCSPQDKCDHVKRKRAKPDFIKTGFAPGVIAMAFEKKTFAKGQHDLVQRWLGAEAVEVAVPSNVEYYKKMDAVSGVRVSYRDDGAP